jgi:hypothetical protein
VVYAVLMKLSIVGIAGVIITAVLLRLILVRRVRHTALHTCNE